MSNDPENQTADAPVPDHLDLADPTIATLAADVRALTSAIRHLVFTLNPQVLQAAAAGHMRTMQALAAGCANLAKKMAEITEPRAEEPDMSPEDMMKMAHAYMGGGA